MEIIFTGRHQGLSEGIKSYLSAKLEKSIRNIPKVNGVHAIVDSERFRHKVEILIQVRAARIRAAEKGEDLKATVDTVLDKIERLLKKYKDKLQYHRTEDKETALMRQAMSAGPDTVRAPRLVRSRKIAPKPMDANEALMQIKLSDEDFLVFLNAETETLNVIYKMKNGDYGLIEPQVKGKRR